MTQRLALVTLIVRRYDEAIAFYTQVLGFTLTSDLDMGGGKRWVVVTPPGPAGGGLLLAEAKTEEEQAAVGRQGAGRVWLFLHTDDFWRDYPVLQSRGLRFLEVPRSEAYGHVAVFEDLYGNKWDLLEPLGE
ncbi:VOC family protein [Hymenobacter agri]